MVSYFERRKKPPLRHALSSHPLFLALVCSFSRRPFSTLEKPEHPRCRGAEKVAFGSELDNVGAACTPLVIYSELQSLVRGLYKGTSYYLKHLPPFFVHGISYSPALLSELIANNVWRRQTMAISAPSLGSNRSHGARCSCSCQKPFFSSSFSSSSFSFS